MKNIIAYLFFYTGISWLTFFFSRMFYGKHIRVINYHGTPSSQFRQFEKQLKWYSNWYENINYQELLDFLENGKWTKEKPGLIISFDDGKRNNYDVAKPLLEKFNFTGWFFIPPGWVVADTSFQKEVQVGDINLLLEYPDGRLIMNRSELNDLQEKHVIGCHTMSHHRMNINDSEEKLIYEIIKSKRALEELTDQNQNIFCWVGGEEIYYTKPAAKMIKEAGYIMAFTTNTLPVFKNTDPFNLDRSNIEVSYSLPLVLFQLSGLMDLFYEAKRKRLKKVFTIE